MIVIAHIGNVPVEEWAPFLVPVLALYFWGRRRDRRHSKEVDRLPDASEALDESTTRHVLARWSQANHADLSAEYVRLFYPPGPEGMTAHELADRVHADPATIERQLGALGELGYLELDTSDAPRAWLTIKGYDLLEATETALLSTRS